MLNLSVWTYARLVVLKKFIFKMIWQLLLWIDQGFSVITGGYADETFSARCYRREYKEKFFFYMRPFVDILFKIFQKDHCYNAYLSEQKRLELPPEYRIETSGIPINPVQIDTLTKT